MPLLDLPRGAVYYTDRRCASPYPPLVLLHGAGGTHLDWPPELRRLPQTRVIALDLPGHGRSPGPGRGDTLDYAADVCALLDALHVERAVIAGHSMGGAVAQQIALNWASRTAGLILIGTGSKLPVEPTLPQRITHEPEKTVDWLVEWSWGVDVPAELKALSRQRLLDVSPQVLHGDYLACQAFDVRERLEQIAARTLVLGAADDRMVRLKFAAFLAERIPKARLVVIEGAGHMFPLEKPQIVAAAIGLWLSEQSWTS
jgi:pimeloyl-ACP methyl ester carboxylesterase